ncbi:hypothetical protein Pyn_36358 [Prunus yedoensis var. nudiflora]|uniref:Uncharacterized protein n=1 Tax=Prunus yedoensis var. nudiflora TaxID=2094558 RepID=A0A314UPM9_PRUYE|nr:hypothetical protein Pyn_36358 [Prunus yedoensis var. nudiflora]
MESHPLPEYQRREISIGLVEKHFVQLHLQPHHPMPPVINRWLDISNLKAFDWYSTYRDRIDNWKELTDSFDVHLDQPNEWAWAAMRRKRTKKILLKPEFKNQTPKRIFKRLAEVLEKYVWKRRFKVEEGRIRMASILEQRETRGVEDGLTEERGEWAKSFTQWVFLLCSWISYGPCYDPWLTTWELWYGWSSMLDFSRRRWAGLRA